MRNGGNAVGLLSALRICVFLSLFIATAAFGLSTPARSGLFEPAAASPAGVYVPVETRTGETVQLYAEEHGTGRPVLMLHGLGASTYTWRNIVPGLARTHRVITLDLKGFGRSDKPFDLAYSPNDHAELVLGFIRRTRLEDLTLVGHSYGGAIALIVAERLAAQRDARLRSLIVMNAPAFPQEMTPFVAFMKLPVVPYAVLSLVPPELSTWLSLEPDNILRTSFADIHAYAKPFWQASARHALITTARRIVPGNLTEIIASYRRIRAPALVVWCDDDPTVPIATGHRLARTLPRARLEILEGCGHAPQEASPHLLGRKLRDFLRAH